jgi:hypothetical protein
VSHTICFSPELKPESHPNPLSLCKQPEAKEHNDRKNGKRRRQVDRKKTATFAPRWKKMKTDQQSSTTYIGSAARTN